MKTYHIRLYREERVSEIAYLTIEANDEETAEKVALKLAEHDPEDIDWTWGEQETLDGPAVLDVVEIVR